MLVLMSILMNPKTWEASGHLGNFNDPMIDNKDSKIVIEQIN